MALAGTLDPRLKKAATTAAAGAPPPPAAGGTAPPKTFTGGVAPGQAGYAESLASREAGMVSKVGAQSGMKAGGTKGPLPPGIPPPPPPPAAPGPAAPPPSEFKHPEDTPEGQYERLLASDAQGWQNQQAGLQSQMSNFNRQAMSTNARMGGSIAGGYGNLAAQGMVQGMDTYNKAATEYGDRRRQLQLQWLDKQIEQKQRAEERGWATEDRSADQEFQREMAIFEETGSFPSNTESGSQAALAHTKDQISELDDKLATAQNMANSSQPTIAAVGKSLLKKYQEERADLVGSLPLDQQGSYIGN